MKTYTGRVPPLNPEGRKIIEELAKKYGISDQAVTTLLQALVAGHGTMAQFSHPELGGPGQWSQGGMTMVGDMFNNALKAKVDGLCSDLADLLRREPSLMQPGTSSQAQSQGGASGQGGTGSHGSASLFVPAAGGSTNVSRGDWWGVDLGVPGASGSQNDMRYAYFPASRRLAVSIGDQVTIYDTGDHEISGVSQQQSGDASVSFASQRGLVRLADLRVVPNRDHHASPPEARDDSGSAAQHGRDQEPEQARAKQPAAISDRTQGQPDDIFFKLDRLAELHKKGIVSDEEFASKKAELLGRL